MCGSLTEDFGQDRGPCWSMEATTLPEETLQIVLRSCMQDEDALLAYLRTAYQANPQTNPSELSHLLAEKVRAKR